MPINTKLIPVNAAMLNTEINQGFYIKECGMTPVGSDPHKQNLLWCEFTPEQARRYLAGE